MNVPFDETVKRFKTKNNVSYTEQGMKCWQNEKDLPGFDNDEIISKNMSADDTVKLILKNCTKNISWYAIMFLFDLALKFTRLSIAMLFVLWYNNYIKND